MVTRKQKKLADDLLRTAEKIIHYRCDLFSTKTRTAFDQACAEVAALVARKEPVADAEFDAAVERLDGLMREHGGKFYPRTFWAENVEVLLVAALIVIGVRSFFLQPFIIPTNSMYPSYSGMQAELYEPGEAPSLGKQILFKAQKFARLTNLKSPASGEVQIPLFSRDPRSPDAAIAGSGIVRYEVVGARRFFILPSSQRRYTLYVGETPVSFNVPNDFSADEVIFDTFFPDGLPEDQVRSAVMSSARPMLATGREISRDEPLIAFNIFLGDALFVDRMSFHFRKPKVGDPIVFRTGAISGIPGDTYYIKRLAGVGGETLEIRDYGLYADGRLRDEVLAFVRNAERTDGFPGYRNTGDFHPGREIYVPEGNYIALGDNSANSSDSRNWGPVREDAVVGRAFFIYYPFTKRWGLAD